MDNNTISRLKLNQNIHPVGQLFGFEFSGPNPYCAQAHNSPAKNLIYQGKCITVLIRIQKF